MGFTAQFPAKKGLGNLTPNGVGEAAYETLQFPPNLHPCT